MLEVGKSYYLSFDGSYALAKYVGAFGSQCNMYEFDIQLDKETKKSVLLTRDEVERTVLYGNT